MTHQALTDFTIGEVCKAHKLCDLIARLFFKYLFICSNENFKNIFFTMWKKRKGKSRSLQKVFDNRQLNIKHCYKVFCISTPLSYTFHFDTFTTEWRCNIMDNFQSWLTWKQQYEYAELFTVWHSFVQDGSKKCSPPYSCIEGYQWKYISGCLHPHLMLLWK